MRSMVRAQIYLTEYERSALSALVPVLGKKQSQLIRDAIDDFIAKFTVKKQTDVLDKLSGVWSDRDESFTAESLRSQWERNW